MESIQTHLPIEASPVIPLDGSSSVIPLDGSSSVIPLDDSSINNDSNLELKSASIWCSCCEITIYSQYWDYHLKTQKHAKNLAYKGMFEIPPHS